MIWNAAMPPYTDIVAEDFASQSIYMTLDLYASFNQQQLHPNSRDCQGQPQLASPLTMTKGFEVLDGVKADLSI